MPKPRKKEATREVASSRTKLRDFVDTSNVKNQARKKRPSEMEIRLRCGTIKTETGGWKGSNWAMVKVLSGADVIRLSVNLLSTSLQTRDAERQISIGELHATLSTQGATISTNTQLADTRRATNKKQNATGQSDWVHQGLSNDLMIDALSARTAVGFSSKV